MFLQPAQTGLAHTTTTELVSFIPVINPYTKERLLEMQLDCGTSFFDAGFDNFVHGHFKDLASLPEVNAEIVPVSSPQAVNYVRIQRRACNYRFVSQILGRIAWLVEQARRGEPTILTETRDNIFIIRLDGEWRELRVRRNHDCDRLDWSAEVSFFGRMRCEPGDRFIIFSQP